MEIVIALLIILLIFFYNNFVRSNKEEMERLQGKMDRLLRETSQLRDEIKNLSKQAGENTPPPVKETPKPQPKPEPPPPVKPAYQPRPSKPVQEERAYKEVPPPKYEPMHVIEESWMQKWWRNNPDLEKFIGENLINKIGIAVLVLGIAFFVKYAIDKNWINEVGRVCIGIFCGVLLTALAHYLRKTYRSFSSVLAGGGIAVFYFTIAFAFHQYQLLSQTAAFLVMVAITGFAIALSVLYNRIELAVIAAVGGFSTPFMVSTGEGNYVVLFTYLVILNSGLLVLAFFKRWPLLNVLALFFTEVIYGGWLVKTLWEQNGHVSYPLALLFATVFYLLFLGMNTVYQVKRKLPFRVFDYSLLLLLNGSYFAAGNCLLRQVNGGQFEGLFTLGVGAVNFLLARYFFRRRQDYNVLLYVFTGLTLTFLSLTIPIQLHGHAVTLFWSVETVLLFWLYQRSRIHLFYYASLLVTVLTTISLLMDWAAALQASVSLALIYTNLQGLVTNLVTAAAFAVFAFLLSKETESLPQPMAKKPLVQAYGIAAFCIAYVTAIYGVNLLFRNATTYEVPNVYHRLVTEATVAILLSWLQRRKTTHYCQLAAGAVLVYFVYHLFSFLQIAGLRDDMLQGRYAMVHWAMHWVSVVAALGLLFVATQFLRKATLQKSAVVWISWIASLVLLIFFSQEAAHLYITVLSKNGDMADLGDQYLKAVLTIVWGLCSFGLMWLGMRYKNRPLRIVSLSVFCLALLKLFFFDIANVSEGGKIAAFILLGVLLLTISFMYQKLKKMIIDDENR